jgi:PAS domain S-box-containing protein
MKENFGLNELLREIESLKSEISDLKMILEAVTGHSDGIEADLMEKVRSGEKLFHEISKTIPVPILITHKTSGDILFSNYYARKLFGYPSDSFLPQKSSDLYENLQDRQIILNFLAEHGYVENFEVQMKKINGSLLWASVFVQPLIFKEQDCLLTIIYDLTERRRAEEEKLSLERQLRQVQKMEAIGTLAGGIAHDFNNILTIILGNLELAKINLCAESAAIKNIANAQTAADRGKTLVRQILTFSCQTEDEYKPFRMSTVISEASDMIRSLISSKIEIRLQIDTETPIVMGSPIQIHQILMNLCANAAFVLKEKGGVIDILLNAICLNTNGNTIIPPMKAGSYAVLTVSDNGPGIDKKIISRIFDPFFTTKKSGEGTGMGLAIVHGIVSKHGGTIRVDSKPGKTAFHCYFPIISDNI